MLNHDANLHADLTVPIAHTHEISFAVFHKKCIALFSAINLIANVEVKGASYMNY